MSKLCASMPAELRQLCFQQAISPRRPRALRAVYWNPDYCLRRSIPQPSATIGTIMRVNTEARDIVNLNIIRYNAAIYCHRNCRYYRWPHYGDEPTILRKVPIRFHLDLDTLFIEHFLYFDLPKIAAPNFTYERGVARMRALIANPRASLAFDLKSLQTDLERCANNDDKLDFFKIINLRRSWTVAICEELVPNFICRMYGGHQKRGYFGPDGDDDIDLVNIDDADQITTLLTTTAWSKLRITVSG